MSAEGDFAPRPWRPRAEYYIADGHDIRDVIEAFGLNYNRGAIVKYIARAGRKPGNDALLDLLKAREHVNREIAYLRSAPSQFRAWVRQAYRNTERVLLMRCETCHGPDEATNSGAEAPEAGRR